MHKYWILFLQYAHEMLAYRLRIILVILSNFATPLILFWIIQSIQTESINGLTPQGMMKYYIFTTILYIAMKSKVDEFVQESIEQGGLATYIVKPVRFWLVALTHDISVRVIKLLFGMPIFILLLIAYSQITVPLDMTLAFTTVGIILLSFFLSFTFSFALGLLAFWIEELWGLQNLKDVAVLLLGGVALPYQFFPVWLQKSLVYTPFPYLINWPLRIGYTGNFLFEVCVALIWITGFAVLSRILWTKGLKRYSALGTY